MKYNFDEIIDRRNTDCEKYDFAKECGKPDGVLPLWVADMDFRVPREVTTALRKSAEHGIFGYTNVRNDYYDSVIQWFQRNFDYTIKRKWTVQTPGVVFALALAVRAFTEKGGGVLIQRPVYHPFHDVITRNERRLVSNSLVLDNGKYRIDFEDFEEKIAGGDVKLFLLCSPHNPVGRVWTKAELVRMGEICARYNCVVVSDEIHCDFVYPGYRHYLFTSLSEEFENTSVLCTAPSKTFNIAGLQTSNIVIRNEDIRKKFVREMEKTGYFTLNTAGIAAAKNAYEYGQEWLDELREYLSGNLAFVRDCLKDMTRVSMVEPEGTYLVWLDFRSAGIPYERIGGFISEKARLWLNDGAEFGAEGAGFQRMNIACPRVVLGQAMEQLRRALSV